MNDKVSEGLKRFRAKLKNIGGMMQTIGASFSAVGGVIVGAFAAATKSFIQAGDQLQDMSTRTGFAIESLSKLSYAAAQSGTSLEAVEKGARGMAKLLLGASQGAAASVETLDALGLSLASLDGQSPDEQFRRIAGAIAGVKDPTLRAALAMKAFGKSGAELLPMLANGTAGMETMFREAERLGIVMSEQDAAAAAELDDAMNQLSSQVKGASVQIGAAVAGPLKELGVKLSEALRVATQVVRDHPDVVKAIAAIGVAAVATGGMVAALGTALTLVTAHPIILGLTLIGTTVAGLYIYFDEITEKTKAWHDALENLFPEGSFANLFAKLLKIRNLQMEIEKNRPKVTGPMFANEDGQAVGGGGGHFSNGETIGGGKGFFSNGDNWDTMAARDKFNRSPQFAATPSLDIGQSQLARLGLNGYEANTSDPSGRAGAAGLVKVFGMATEAMQEKMKDVAAAADAYFDPIIEKVQGEVDAAMKYAGEMASDHGTGKALATLDASYAAQQFGGRSREVDLLTSIDRNGAKLLEKMAFEGGIPGG